MKDIGAIVQARMSSARTPGKVLRKIAGKPLLAYLIESLRKSHSFDKIVVAVSSDNTDDVLCDFCESLGVECYRGSLENVAERFKETLERYQFSAFARVCGDSPLLDYRLLDKGVKIFKEGGYDIVTNALERNYPAVEAVEIFSTGTFMKHFSSIRSREDAEHVTIYFYKNYKKFNIFNLVPDEDYSDIRLSVDYPRDLEVLSSIVACMKRPHWEYDISEIVRFYKKVIKEQ